MARRSQAVPAKALALGRIPNHAPTRKTEVSFLPVRAVQMEHSTVFSSVEASTRIATLELHPALEHFTHFVGTVSPRIPHLFSMKDQAYDTSYLRCAAAQKNQLSPAQHSAPAALGTWLPQGVVGPCGRHK